MIYILIYKLKNIIIAWGGSLIIVFLLLIFLTKFAPDYLPYSYVDKKSSLTLLQLLVSSCIVAPIWEELLFRHLPMQILKRLSDEQKFLNVQWYIIGLLAIIFGWMHGNVYNIFIQGVAGFGLGWVYIKNGHCYFSSVLCHALWNFMIVIGVSAFN